MEFISEEVYANTLEQPVDIVFAILFHVLFIIGICTIPYAVFPSDLYTQWHQAIAAFMFVVFPLAGIYLLMRSSLHMGFTRLYGVQVEEIKVSSEGFVMPKNGPIKKSWKKVKSVDIRHQKEKENTIRRLVTFYFSKQRSITIEDDNSWSKVKAIQEHSDNLLGRVPVQVDMLDERLLFLVPSANVLHGDI